MDFSAIVLKGMQTNFWITTQWHRSSFSNVYCAPLHTTKHVPTNIDFKKHTQKKHFLIIVIKRFNFKTDVSTVKDSYYKLKNTKLH